MNRWRTVAVSAALVLPVSLMAQDDKTKGPELPQMTDEAIDTAIATLNNAMEDPKFAEDPSSVLSMPLYRFGGAILKGGQLNSEQEKRVLGYLKELKTIAPSEKERISTHIFQVQNLTIGKMAPDIVGEDLDEVPFKLSDYRGKVVVIDFWGDW